MSSISIEGFLAQGREEFFEDTPAVDPTSIKMISSSTDTSDRVDSLFVHGLVDKENFDRSLGICSL